MTEESSAGGLELRAAHARRKYWQEQQEQARIAGDASAEAHAAGYVREYEDFIASLERLQRSAKLGVGC